MHMFSKKYQFTLLFLLIISSGFAQVQFSRKYRVIAYKSSNPSIFSVSNEVEVIPAMTLYIPNTFTPNGDGMNDTFGVSGEAIKNFNMVIYNRWGQKIFETNDANNQWDGTFNGTKVSVGAYVYNVSAQGPTGGKQSKKGSFDLIQ